LFSIPGRPCRAPAAAELAVSLGMAYFRWKEATTPSVTETGPMLALGLAYNQEKDDGGLFAYRDRAYFGDVDRRSTVRNPRGAQ
jgi:hypothetical protein